MSDPELAGFLRTKKEIREPNRVANLLRNLLYDHKFNLDILGDIIHTGNWESIE